jgi:geranylgeranyl diphosphate synthase type I
LIPTKSVPEVLGQTRALVQPALLEAIRSLSEEVRPLAAYHLGFVDDKGSPLPGGLHAGKGVRSTLVLLAAEAVGGSARMSVPGAVAIELVHNFSLIHDDVIDDDTERRHRPTLWAVFGIGRAIVTGDALSSLALELVLDAGETADQSLRAARCLARATSVMIAGQALDMAFEQNREVSLERCRSMEAQKTGALLGCATSLGAILGGAPDIVVTELDTFGMELGLAFQAVDDILGIWGDPETTGKPAWSDLRQRKKTLPIVAALEHGGERAGELARLLSQEHLGDHEIARAAELVELCGGREYATAAAQDHLHQGLRALERVPLVPAAREGLVLLARFITAREF